jgi:hypothetical protein
MSMTNQRADADNTPSNEQAELYLTEEELDDMRKEFAADLEKIQEAMKAAQGQRHKGLD